MRKFRIYRNLHKDNYSILQSQNGKWLKVDEADALTANDCAILIHPSGQARVRKEHRKYVHAFVCCNSYTKEETMPSPAYQIRYNPYKDDTFVYTKGKRGLKLEAPLYHRRLHLRTDGVFTPEANPKAYPHES